jgi:hypothetical protein
MNGYPRLSGMQDHPREHNGQVAVHILKAEIALGKSLPSKAQIHHVDYDKYNSDNTNLVVCENQAYHYLLHKRTDALKACGNPNWRKCKYCQVWDDPKNMYSNDGYALHYHRSCRATYRLNFKHRTGRAI